MIYSGRFPRDARTGFCLKGHKSFPRAAEIREPRHLMEPGHPGAAGRCRKFV